MNTNYGARPGIEHDGVHCACGNVVAANGKCVECAPVESHEARGPLCACGCGTPLGDDECANERGEPSGVHADCWAAYCAGLRSEDEDRRVDRAQEREMFREWGGR